MIVMCIAEAIVQATTDVSSHLLRAPLTHNLAIVYTPLAALTHLLFLAGIVGLRQSGAGGGDRTARAALTVAAGGTALLFACEWVLLAFIDERTAQTGPTILVSMFGLASALLTVGMIVAGVRILRVGRWTGWTGRAPLACGLLSLIVLPVQVTSVLWAGLIVYAIAYIVLACALIARARPEPVTSTVAPALQIP